MRISGSSNSDVSLVFPLCRLRLLWQAVSSVGCLLYDTSRFDKTCKEVRTRCNEVRKRTQLPCSWRALVDMFMFSRLWPCPHPHAGPPPQLGFSPDCLRLKEKREKLWFCRLFVFLPPVGPLKCACCLFVCVIYADRGEICDELGHDRGLRDVRLRSQAERDQHRRCLLRPPAEKTAAMLIALSL